MRTLIFATASNDNIPFFSYECPTPLLSIVDKPILIHIIEQLVTEGITKIEILLNHHSEQIQSEIGNGNRWGVEISYHLVKDPRYPFAVLRTAIPSWTDEELILCQGDILPLEMLEHLVASQEEGFLLYNDQQEWLGWAKVQKKHLNRLIASTTFESLESALNKHPIQKHSCSFLTTRSIQGFLDANHYAIAESDHTLLFPTAAREVKSQVWIAASASIDSNVKLIPPVYIGGQCLIKEGVSLGPYVVIESGSIVDKGSRLEQAVLCRNSYVGQSLEIINSAVSRSTIANAALDTHIEMNEPFILSGLKGSRSLDFIESLIEKMIAAAFLLLSSPLFLILFIFKQITYRHVVGLPSFSPSPSHWKKTTLMQFKSGLLKQLPFLWNILKGELHFVGVPERSLHEVEKLPADWRKLYLESKIGLITLSDVHDSEISQENLFVCEAYYCAHRSPIFDIKIIIKYLKKCVTKKMRLTFPVKNAGIKE